MSDKIKELKEQLAKAEAEEVKGPRFTVVVFDDDMETLKEIEVAARDLTEKDKANIMHAAGNLGDNFDKIKILAKNLDETTGKWLELLYLIDDPLKEIIAGVFGLNAKIVSTLPNLDLLKLIFEGNPWINSKAGNFAKELDYISSKK